MLFRSKLLGDFNNDGFTLHLENTGDHDYVFISFDLYIHGTWDGNFNGFSENDKARRNTIANLLAEWELISLADAGKTEEPTVPLSQLKILSFKEKDEWELTPKYNIGNKRETDADNE